MRCNFTELRLYENCRRLAICVCERNNTAKPHASMPVRGGAQGSAAAAAATADLIISLAAVLGVKP